VPGAGGLVRAGRAEVLWPGGQDAPLRAGTAVRAGWRRAVKVTRIAYSRDLNPGKLAALAEQARRLAQVRALAWHRYGSLGGLGVTDRQVRDQWMGDGTAAAFGVLATPWKETLRDAMGDIRATREAAKVKVRQAIFRRTEGDAERKRLCTALKYDGWTSDSYLCRLMRRHWPHGRSHVTSQIVVRSDDYRTYTLTDGGNVWLSVPGLEPGKRVKIPLDTTIAPAGTLRVILVGGRAEIHYQTDADTMRSSARPHGDQALGVDKGYTEVLTDSDGIRHGPALGPLLTAESDRLKVKNQRRSRLRAIAGKAAARGDHAKAARIARHNLGTVTRDRARRRFEAKVRTVTFEAVHAVIDKASAVVAEDLTKAFASRRKLGPNVNRRLASWTKGVTAEALSSVSERRGSALVLVNAAYTSQADPITGALGVRRGDKLHCPGGDVWQADHAAAINILKRQGDPDITLHIPHTRVKQILQERTDRHRASTAGPGLQPQHPGSGERNIHSLQPTGNSEEAG
jgi:transposase